MSATVPMLLIQVIYKTLWLVVFVLSVVVWGQAHAVAWCAAGTFLFTAVTDLWVIPWSEILHD